MRWVLRDKNLRQWSTRPNSDTLVTWLLLEFWPILRKFRDGKHENKLSDLFQHFLSVSWDWILDNHNVLSCWNSTPRPCERLKNSFYLRIKSRLYIIYIYIYNIYIIYPKKNNLFRWKVLSAWVWSFLATIFTSFRKSLTETWLKLSQVKSNYVVQPTTHWKLEHYMHIKS